MVCRKVEQPAARYWMDRWAGHLVTRAQAQAEAAYTSRMHDAAMRGRLKEFLAQTKGPQQ